MEVHWHCTRASAQIWRACWGQVDMTAGAFETFDRMHGGDQMAVDKLREGIESFAKDQTKVEALVHELIPQVMTK